MTKHEKTIKFFPISRFLLILPLIVLFIGCTESETEPRQVKLEQGQVKQIVMGQTTRDQVESLLGKPTSIEKSHGQTEMIYRNWTYQEHGISVPGTVAHVAPFPSLGVYLLFGKAAFTDNITTFVIEKDGVVADIKQMLSESHLSGAFVEDTYPHPDVAQIDKIIPGETTAEQVRAILGAPPWAVMSKASIDNSQYAMWLFEKGQLVMLEIIFRQDGVAEEVKKIFKGGPWFPKRVNPDKVARIKEQQSTRKEAESILGRPLSISRNAQGSFYTYSIQTGKIKEEIYIQYDSRGTISSIMRKPYLTLPSFL